MDKPNITISNFSGSKEFGNVIGLYLGSLPAVVVTDYEGIKELFKKEEVSARPETAPTCRFRPGWETMAHFDPEINYNRQPGVAFSSVTLHIRVDQFHDNGKIEFCRGDTGENTERLC